MGNTAHRRARTIAKPATVMGMTVAALIGLAPAATAAESTTAPSTGATVSVPGIVAEIILKPFDLSSPIQFTLDNTWGP